jgi:hypothetical protein
MKVFFLAAVFVFTCGSIGPATSAEAQTVPADYYSLKRLDKLGTCALGTIQEVNAELALSHLKAFTWWNVKDQLEQIHPDYISWHSSIAGLLEVMPHLKPYVPAQNGQWTAKNYVETLAFLASANDIDKYEVEPTRVDCVGDSSVVLVNEFRGLQIRRDPATGCVTHGVPFGSPVKIMLELRDYQASPTAPTKRLVYRSVSNLDDRVSAEVRVKLAEVVKGPPNMPNDPSTCKTPAQILREFKDQDERHEVLRESLAQLC